MKTRGYQDNLFREIIVVNFAGAGGADTGIEFALGQPVDIAVNHDADAIAMHKVNHPFTKHYQEDVFAIEPENVTGGRPVGVAWFSPDCKHFSRAKGGKPVEKKIRGLSWVILKWAMSKSAPRRIFMENVPEIQTWGPLKEIDGNLRPDPAREGETFKGFIAMLTTGIDKAHPAFLEACEFLKIEPFGAEANKLAKGLGYEVKYEERKACIDGAPTIRNRFYMIARNDGEPIIFPKPTHGKGKDLLPYKTAADCLDFSIHDKSIFNRSHSLAANTLARIARGLKKFVINSPNPYIMSNNTGNAPHGIDEPVPTITTGNRNYLLTPYISKYFGGKYQAGARVDEPTPTITAIDHNALITPRLAAAHICTLRNNMDGQSALDPLSTITAAASHHAVVKSYFAKYEADGKSYGNWEQIRELLNKYAGYNIKNDEILIFDINGEEYFLYDIGMRMLEPFELAAAQGCPKDYILDIEPYIGKKYSKAKQVARIGNMVCPPVAAALIRANCADIAVRNNITTMSALHAEFEKTLRSNRSKKVVA